MSFSGLLASIAAILAATLLPWSNFVGHSHWAKSSGYHSMATVGLV